MENQTETNINIRLTYPNSKEYDFFTKIDVIDLDKEAENDIRTGNGFLISSPMSSIKKDIKNPDGIYSSRFGQKLGDINPFADRYSCECGNLKSRINHGLECPLCHTVCKYVDDDFKMFGWIRIVDEYHIIHPKFYKTLDYIFGASPYNIERKKIKGTKLENMLNYSPEVDENGFMTECKFKPDNEPFYGIGMIEFYNRFDEILNYYYAKNPKKKEYYDEVQEYHNIVFCHSIPVFTTHLRPADIKDGFMCFEPTNATYNMINKLVYKVNNNKRKQDRDPKNKNLELFRVQMKYMELVNEIINILSGKKGQLRMLIGGQMSALLCSNI